MIEYENLGKLNQSFFEDYRQAFDEVLNSGWYILGKAVQQFEKDFAFYCNTSYCCGVANGLDAMILALKALKIENHDEVIVPSNTYIATILSILHAGLKPVLVEPDIETYSCLYRRFMTMPTPHGCIHAIDVEYSPDIKWYNFFNYCKVTPLVCKCFKIDQFCHLSSLSALIYNNDYAYLY